MVRVLHWNGKDLPGELRQLPPGDYVIADWHDDTLLSPADPKAILDEFPDEDLTPEQEEGILQARASIERGEFKPWSEVHAHMRDLVHRR